MQRVLFSDANKLNVSFKVDTMMIRSLPEQWARPTHFPVEKINNYFLNFPIQYFDLRENASQKMLIAHRLVVWSTEEIAERK